MGAEEENGQGANQRSRAFSSSGEIPVGKKVRMTGGVPRGGLGRGIGRFLLIQRL